MKTLLISSSKHVILAITYGAIGITVALLYGAIWFLNARPDLSSWHTTQLSAQYHHDMHLTDFKQYIALEDKLFAEIESKVFSQTQGVTNQPLNRYVRGSYSDPQKWSFNWNRSFEWQSPQAEFGLLLIHGMSDSPYSMSHFAQHFKQKAHVLGLRLPGHGTLPSGLVDVTWQEMAEVVALATEHMQKQLGGKPLYVIAFSTGAALALNHELEALSQNKGTSYAGLIFVSPAIGLTPVAAGAKWQDKLGQFLGLEKLSWNAIQTEYDPFKYNSFAVNAGDVVYQLAEQNQSLFDKLSLTQVAKLADVLTFQSIADSTVSTPDVIIELYQRLAVKNNQLVLFDINRLDVNMALIIDDPMDALKPLIMPELMQYELTLVQNQKQINAQTTAIAREVEAVRYRMNQTPQHEPLSLAWPTEVYSLSHVALPFPASDELYGPNKGEPNYRVHIGASAIRGERGVFGVSAAETLRQKWNPFFPYMIQRIENYIEAEQSSK